MCQKPRRFGFRSPKVSLREERGGIGHERKPKAWWRVESMKPRGRIFAVGTGLAVLGIALAATPWGQSVETGLGLDALFRLRGAVPPPQDVLIVSIDRRSADYFDLPNQPRKWPRSLHGELVEELAERGASVVAFDLDLRESRDAKDDQAFADAVARAGNVLLLSYLNAETFGTVRANDKRSTVRVERLVPPVRELAEAAKSLAPFPLPKVPAKVNQAWLFKEGAGNAATLPAVAFQMFARPEVAFFERQLARQFSTRGRLATPLGLDEQQKARRIRETLTNEAAVRRSLKGQLEAASMDLYDRERLDALWRLYAGESHAFLNFYGGPGAVRTVPYHHFFLPRRKAVTPTLPSLEGKAVFVGFAEQRQPEQEDGFYTAFTRADGVDVSGVEIAATTFANLADQRMLRVLSPSLSLALHGVWALVLMGLLTRFSGLYVLPVALLCAAALMVGVYYLFATWNWWIPFVIMVGIQLPMAAAFGLVWHYRVVRNERENVRSTFGLYVPSQAVDELVENRDRLGRARQLTEGICLATDAKGYSSVAEGMTPDALHHLLNQYFAIVFAAIRRERGLIVDVIGDASLSVWSTQMGAGAYNGANACHAALAMLDDLGQFAQSTSGPAMTVRVGLHRGPLSIGNVGAGSHFEFRAVGDTVNVASRLEGLNKQLGTHILASKAVVDTATNISTRRLGQFRLAGRSAPTDVYEILGEVGCEGISQPMLGRFDAGLRAFEQEQFTHAARSFAQCLALMPDDGPSRFYLDLCERYAAESSPRLWDGVVALVAK